MAEWQQANVVVNGLKIHYTRTGGSKPPLVLSHGATDDGLCWTRLAQALQDDYDVVLPDARGHGRSGSGRGDYSSTARAEDLVGLIGALRLERPVIMGHSMGAQTTLFAAALYPESIRAAVLEDPILILEGETVFGQGTARDLGQLMRKGARRTKLLPRFLLRRMAQKYTLHYPPVELEPWIASKKRLSWDFIRSLAVIKEETTGMEILSRVQCPLLLITGERDKGAIVSPQGAAQAQSICATCKVAHVAGSGHNIRRDQFEAYLAVVREFLKGLPA
ncbi:MAG: alpha/beta hydrolase [Anaerolineae bacterium]|nr:alpha/beta hydrolase [Anaerolineae bacterium]